MFASSLLYARFLLSLLVVAVPCALPGQTVPRPPGAVPIENTNAAFAPSDAAVPQASPTRPTFTAPAHIPPTGYLQFEQGFNQANGSPAGTDGQFALSQSTKISLTTRLMVQYIDQPYVRSRIASPTGGDVTSNDPGDLLVAGQAILHKSVGPVPVVAMEYIRRVRAGSSADLDIGSYSQAALLLLSGDLPDKFHYDSNISLYEQNSGPVRRPQLSQTLAVSHPLLEQATEGKLAGVAELSHFTQPLVSSASSGRPVDRANAVELLFAGIYQIKPNLVLDAAFVHGLTSTSTQWQGSFGFTYLLPHRLWRDRHPAPVPVGPYHYRNPR